MKNVEQPLGPFFDNNGSLLVGGAVYFLDADTSAEKIIYLDETKTIAAQNPQYTSSDGRLNAQIFLGDGKYKVRTFKVNDSTSPLFPDDYSLVDEWIQDGFVDSSVYSSSIPDVLTVSALRALAPVDGDGVRLVGYYASGDAPMVGYTYKASEIGVDNGGTIIRPNDYGSGAWVMNPVSRIDVRNFGALTTGNVNARISFAAGQALVRHVPLYFPYGVYEVSGTVIQTISCDIVIDPSAYFMCTSGVYTMTINGRWDIAQGIHSGDAGGSFIIDLRTNPYFHYEGADPRWWYIANWADSFKNAALYCGSSGLMLRESIVIGDRSSSFIANVKRLVYAGGYLHFSPSTAYSMVIGAFEDNKVGGNVWSVFGSTSGNIGSYLSFECNIKASWFMGAFDCREVATVTAPKILLNGAIECTSDISINSVFVPSGGLINVETFNVTALGYEDGLAWVSGSSGTFSAGGTVPKATNWIIGNQSQFECFLRSCAGVNCVADCYGKSCVYNATITGDLTISGWLGNVSVITATSIRANNCRGGGFSGGVVLDSCQDVHSVSGSLTAHSSSFSIATISLSELNAYGCTFNASAITVTSDLIICITNKCVMQSSTLNLSCSASGYVKDVIIDNDWINCVADPLTINILAPAIYGTFFISKNNNKMLLNVDSLPTTTVIPTTEFEIYTSQTSVSYASVRWAAVLPNVEPTPAVYGSASLNKFSALIDHLVYPALIPGGVSNIQLPQKVAGRFY